MVDSWVTTGPKPIFTDISPRGPRPPWWVDTESWLAWVEAQESDNGQEEGQSREANAELTAISNGSGPLTALSLDLVVANPEQSIGPQTRQKTKAMKQKLLAERSYIADKHRTTTSKRVESKTKAKQTRGRTRRLRMPGTTSSVHNKRSRSAPTRAGSAIAPQERQGGPLPAVIISPQGPSPILPNILPPRTLAKATAGSPPQVVCCSSDIPSCKPTQLTTPHSLGCHQAQPTSDIDSHAPPNMSQASSDDKQQIESPGLQTVAGSWAYQLAATRQTPSIAAVSFQQSIADQSSRCHQPDGLPHTHEIMWFARLDETPPPDEDELLPNPASGHGSMQLQTDASDCTLLPGVGKYQAFFACVPNSFNKIMAAPSVSQPHFAQDSLPNELESPWTIDYECVLPDLPFLTLPDDDIFAPETIRFPF